MGLGSVGVLATLALLGTAAPDREPDDLPLAPDATPVEGVDSQVQGALDKGDLDAAEALLLDAHRRSGDAGYLYMAAEARRHAGQCERALVLYERFIAEQPPALDVDAASEGITACRAQRAPAAVIAPVEPTPRDPGPAVKSSPARQTGPEPPRPWYRDRWGAGLVGTGLALAVAGAVMVGVAHGSTRQLEDTPQYGQYADDLRRLQIVNRTGIGVLVTGSVVVVAGAIRFGWVAKRRRGGGASRVARVR